MSTTSIELSSGLAGRITLTFHHDAVGLNGTEFLTTVGVDVAAICGAPSGESVGVDVRFDNNHPLPNVTLAQLFSLVLPLQESSRQDMPVDEQGSQLLVIRFAIPRNPESLNLHR